MAEDQGPAAARSAMRWGSSESGEMMKASLLTRTVAVIAVAALLLVTVVGPAKARDLPAGLPREVVFEAIYQLVFAGLPDHAATARWNGAPKVVVGNATEEEEALVKDCVKQFSDLLSPRIFVVDDASKASIYISFVDEYYNFGYDDKWLAFAANRPDEARRRIEGKILTWPHHFFIDIHGPSDFLHGAVIVISRKNKPMSRRYLIRGLATAFGFVGLYNGARTVASQHEVDDRLTELDKFALSFIYFGLKGGETWSQGGRSALEAFLAKGAR